MDRIFKEIEDGIKEIIKDYPVDFIILFGSLAEGRFRDYSDIDLGIHLEKDLDLLEIGDIVSRLESKLERDIDIVLLNDIYSKDSLFAFEIISKGIPLYIKDNKRFVEFKYRTFIEFMDTEYLRRILDEGLKERIKNRRIGIRGCLRKG